MISKLFNFLRFFRKPDLPMRTVSFTTEPVQTVIEPKEKILKEFWCKGKLSHSDLVMLTHMYFDITFKKSYYKLKEMSAYGLYFEIVSYQLVIDKEKFQENMTLDLVDVLLHLNDVSGNTSLKICVSVKELNDLFEVFIPDLSFLTKS